MRTCWRGVRIKKTGRGGWADLKGILDRKLPLGSVDGDLDWGIDLNFISSVRHFFRRKGLVYVSWKTSCRLT